MKKDKDLLLKYLCMALPYGVICNDNRHGSSRVTNIDITPDDIEHKNPKVVLYYFDFDECGGLKNCKPYLRTMSSMTEDESSELSNIISEWWDKELFTLTEEPMIEFALSRLKYSINPMLFNWLLENHFDFMGLIPKDLAIEVTESNNTYKE